VAGLLGAFIIGLSLGASRGNTGVLLGASSIVVMEGIAAALLTLFVLRRLIPDPVPPTWTAARRVVFAYLPYVVSGCAGGSFGLFVRLVTPGMPALPWWQNVAIVALAATIWVGLAMLTIETQQNKERAVSYIKSLQEEIHKRRRAEDDLRGSKAELERRVSERTTQLSVTNTLLESELDQRRKIETQLQSLYQQEHTVRSKLESEMQKRVEFLRTLVHELKTPLTSIMASSELLILELPEGDLSKVSKTIHRSSNNLNSRIDELMDLARGEIGMLTIDCQSMDLLSLLRGVHEEITPVITRHGQTLVMNLPRELPKVWADEQRIRQVVMNLLGNASKFMNHEGTITLSGWEEDGEMHIEVRDTGPGIAEEEQERLFQPYYRCEGDRERFSGLGLGLALSKTLVDLHGGRIWVSSTKDQGSTFTLSLPLEAGASESNSVLPERNTEDSCN